MIQRAIASILCWGMSVLLISFFLLPKFTSVFLKILLPLVAPVPLLLPLLLLQRLPHLRGYALDKPPELFILLLQRKHLHLLFSLLTFSFNPLFSCVR